MKKKYLCALLLLGLFLPLKAQVTFSSLDSFAQVKPDDTAEVIETFSLFAPQEEEDFSFFRDLPLSKNQLLQVVEVSANGNKITPLTRQTDRTLRVFFSNHQPLSAGSHIFQLYYKIDRAVTFLKPYDRFDWTVFSNTTTLPVSFVRFRLELPQQATPLEGKIRAFLTATNHNIRPAQQEDLVFWSINPLRPQETFTVSVAFRKGAVQRPTPSFLRGPDRKGMTLCILFLLFAIYCWIAWESVGRDPRSRVVRRHLPPANISAVKAQYIRTMGKEVSIATALLSLAIKGAVEIEICKNGKWKNQVIVRPKLRYKMVEPLPNEEDAVYYGLFATVGTRWIVDPTDFNTRKRIQDTYLILQDCLQGDCAQTFFARNSSYNFPSFLFLFIGACILSATQPLLFFPYLLAGGLLYLLSFWACHYNWEKVALLLGIWLAAGLFGLFPLRIFSFNAGTVAFAGGAVLGGCFLEWIRAYTVPGRIAMDQLEGFKEYLLRGEKTRLAQTNPTDSLKFFCRYLPYAYALGISTKWTQRFENFFDYGALNVLEKNGLVMPDLSGLLSALDPLFFSIAAGGGGKQFDRN